MEIRLRLTLLLICSYWYCGRNRQAFQLFIFKQNTYLQQSNDYFQSLNFYFMLLIFFYKAFNFELKKSVSIEGVVLPHLMSTAIYNVYI